MTVTITIACDNDAFQPHSGRELQRILRYVGARLAQNEPDDFRLVDSNGNTCGKVVVSE